MELKDSPAGNFRLAQFVDHFCGFFRRENAVRRRLHLKQKKKKRHFSEDLNRTMN